MVSYSLRDLKLHDLIPCVEAALRSFKLIEVVIPCFIADFSVSQVIIQDLITDPEIQS